MLVNNIGESQPVIEKIWKPTPKQQQVLSLPDSVFECLGGGAAFGGKTDLGIMLPCIRQFTEHPRFKGLVLRRTFADLEKEIVPRQHEWYEPQGAVYNETKKVWKFPSGARIQNGHAEREQDVRKYDSAEYNYIDWDEATHFTEFQYLYLSLSRCRSSSADLPAIVRAFTNPGNVGHGFFKKRFVSPHRGGLKILIDKVTKQKRIFIPFKATDNSYGLANDPGYLARLEGLPEQERRAKLHGDWDSYEGQVFSEFRIAHIPGEPGCAVHVITPFPIPDWWPKLICIDWGFAAMTFVIWAAVSPSGRVYIYRTYSCQRKTIKLWAPEIVNLTGDEQIEDAIICHSAGQHKGEEKTVQQQVNDAFDGRCEFRLADKDRVGGKNMIHEYLRWEQLPATRIPDIEYDHEVAMKLMRQGGEFKYNEYLNLFLPHEPETNLPKLVIFESSLEGLTSNTLIDVIPACVPAEHNPEDVEEFKGDDPYDTLRMVVKAAHLYTAKSNSKFEELQKKQELLDALQRTNNQTSYYRAMEKLEAENDSDNQSVRRHRAVGNHRFSVR